MAGVRALLAALTMTGAGLVAGTAAGAEPGPPVGAGDASGEIPLLVGDRPSAAARGVVAGAEAPSPWRGSTLTLDESVTTQSLSIGDTPQSYVPLDELWVSFRPAYHFDEHWSVRGRFDYYKELTNAQSTTYRNEDVLGDVWTDLVYETRLDGLWRGTKADASARALWPLSKASQANGTYVTAGLGLGARHSFDLRGDDAYWLRRWSLRMGLVYLHPFSAATTPTDFGTFAYVREDADGRSFISDQVTGQTLPEHVLWTAIQAALQLTPRASVRGDVVLIDEWHYAPAASPTVPVSGGLAVVPATPNDNQHTEDTWIVAEVDYALLDEVTLSLGYYNLANAVAPDGQARGLFGGETIWWSPSARLFFDVTANLDRIVDDLRGRDHDGGAPRAPGERQPRVARRLP